MVRAHGSRRLGYLPDLLCMWRHREALAEDITSARQRVVQRQGLKLAYDSGNRLIKVERMVGVDVLWNVSADLGVSGKSCPE